MSARVCDDCGVNWPNLKAFKDCPICDEETDYAYTKNPDFTEEEAHAHAREALARVEASKGKPTPEHADRVARYLELGFTEVDAHVLALAKWTEHDSKRRVWVRPLDPTRVARALASGCTHAQAVEIFT